MAIRLTQFEELWSAVKKYNIRTIANTEIEAFERGQGIDIESGEIFHTKDEELFTVLTDGSIRKIIIHIVDISSWTKYERKHPRFHIYHCETIKKMIEKGRKYRYRASSGIEGKFQLIQGRRKWNESLEICSYCLTLYNEKFKQNKVKRNFVIANYTNQPIHHSGFQDVKWDICTIPNTYVKSWNQISKKRKEAHKYKCEGCGMDYASEQLKRFLHVHHVDANKQNNTLGNLKVLCIECHANQYNHGHIKRTPQYKEYLKIKRQAS